MKANDFKPIILTFLIAMIGISFLIAINNTVASGTNNFQQVNESLSIAAARQAANQINNGTNFTLAQAAGASALSPITNLIVVNSSGTVIAATNYTLNANTGNITFLNTTFMVSGGGANNITNLSYLWYPTNYIDDNGSRTMYALIPVLTAIFFALALLGYWNWEAIKEWAGY